MSSENDSAVRRASKACDECRRRKIKCNGALPCSSCSKVSSLAARCNYRLVNRVRKRRVPPILREDAAQIPNLDISTRRSLGDQDNDSSRSSQENLDDDVHQSVHAAQSNIQLYYGPSSNFAFQNTIHRALAQTAAHNLNSASTDGKSVLDYYKFQDIFFGVDQSSHIDKSANTANSSFLQLDTAIDFLEKFLMSVYHLVPFWSPEALRRMVKQLFDQNETKSLAPGSRCIALLVLANGATLTRHATWPTLLYDKAAIAAASFDDTVNLEAVQILLLQAYYQASAGRANTSYLQVGMACRKAYAAGLHKDIEYKLLHTEMDRRAEERRITFWSLIFWERWVSFWLGRPSSAILSTISVPYPKSNNFVMALAEMSTIIVKSASDVYDNNHQSQSKLWERAQYISLELRNFQRRMEPILGFTLDGSNQNTVISVDQYFITNFLMHLWMITFRPFLVIYSSWKKRNPPTTSPVDSTVRPASLPNEMWWLPEACSLAVGYARANVQFFALAVDQSSIIQGLVFSAAYLENACYILIFDAMLSRSSADSHILTLEEALNCLRKLVLRPPISSVVQMIQKMVNDLKEIEKINDIHLESSQLPPTNTEDLIAMQYDSRAVAQYMAEPSGDILQNEWPSDFGFDIFASDLGAYFNPAMTDNSA